MGITVEEEKTYKECFEMFDEEDEGVVAVNQLHKMTTLLGWNPAQRDLDEVVRKCKLSKEGNMTKNDFTSIMTVWRTKPKYSDAEIKAAFSVLDPKSFGYIKRDALLYVLMNVGEPLSSEEADQMMIEADTDGDGQIDYGEFVAMLTGDHIRM